MTWRLIESIRRDIVNKRNIYYENNIDYEDHPLPPPKPRQFHLPCNNCAWAFCKSCPWGKNMTWEEIRRTKFLMMNPPNPSHFNDDRQS